jgi:muramoyltetrapeptide carboxypeptidase
VGGNLALVAALCGTPWAVDLRGSIVVLEDIGEAAYRLDRMLTQLRLAGAFDNCAGVVFGQFTNCPEGTEDGSRPLHNVFEETVAAVGVPAIAGVPVGHIADQWTVPFGELATLDVARRTITLHRSSNVTVT